jgi:RES domain-containing protein
LPPDWKKRRAPTTTKQIGDLWVAANESVVLKVPSVIIEGENNYLLNPGHPDFGKVLIGEPQAFRFDRRLK